MLAFVSEVPVAATVGGGTATGVLLRVLAVARADVVVRVVASLLAVHPMVGGFGFGFGSLPFSTCGTVLAGNRGLHVTCQPHHALGPRQSAPPSSGSNCVCARQPAA